MGIRNAAKAIVIKDGKLLLNRCVSEQGAEYYALPGGGQHLFEPLEETVVREVREETGLTVRVQRFLAVTEEIRMDAALREKHPDYAHRMMHIFLACVEEEGLAPQEMDLGQRGSVWVTPEQADTLRVVPQSLRGNLSALLRGGLSPWLGTIEL